MHELDILRDLAVVMVVAGAVILLFHWLRQPATLGYIIAGVIIGPFTPPFPLVQEIDVINVLAEIGIIMLMFSLGLEFSLKKLRNVGKVAVIGGAFQILMVFILGYYVGLALGWGTVNALFLGAGLSISSTALIVKVLEEQHRMSERASQVVFGILVFEDFAAVAMIALLPGLGAAGTVDLAEVGLVLLKFLVFGGVSLLFGMSVVPRLMNYVIGTSRTEFSVIAGLAICFGMALLSRSLGLSVAAGAFIAGALVAEARRSESFAHIMVPIKDMFAALFFVAIGMLLDPVYLIEFWPHILLLTLVLVVGKVISGTMASFLLGYNRHNALRVGMSLAQIGEFSLIIVKVGQDAGVVDQFLYPVIVGVTGLSTLTTPYVIRGSFHAGEYLDRMLSPTLRGYLQSAETALQRFQTWAGESGSSGRAIRRSMTGIIINLFLFTIAIGLGRLAYENLDAIGDLTGLSSTITIPALGVLILLVVAFPLIAIVHYVQSLATIAADTLSEENGPGAILTRPIARVILRNSTTIVLLVPMSMLIGLFVPWMPTVPYLPFLIIGLAVLLAFYLLWDSIHVFHQRVEDLLRERVLGEDGLGEEVEDPDSSRVER